MRHFAGITTIDAALAIDPVEAAAMIKVNEEIEGLKRLQMIQAIFGSGEG